MTGSDAPSDDEKMVLSNRVCPFAEKGEGRLAMCMTTSNVFGVIAAEDLDCAKIELRQTSAMGDPGCPVAVCLSTTAASETADGCGGRWVVRIASRQERLTGTSAIRA
jgi:hypothetical protein